MCGRCVLCVAYVRYVWVDCERCVLCNVATRCDGVWCVVCLVCVIRVVDAWSVRAWRAWCVCVCHVSVLRVKIVCSRRCVLCVGVVRVVYAYVCSTCA